MRIRELTGADAPQVAALFAASRAAALAWLPVLHTADEDVAFFTGQITAAARVGCALGAWDGDDLRGFAVASPGWLDHLYVAPGWRGQGIGSALLAGIRAARPEALLLWVFARNAAALRFYAGHGAIEQERTDGSGNEEREPDVRLLLPAADRPDARSGGSAGSPPPAGPA